MIHGNGGSAFQSIYGTFVFPQADLLVLTLGTDLLVSHQRGDMMRLHHPTLPVLATRSGLMVNKRISQLLLCMHAYYMRYVNVSTYSIVAGLLYNP